MQRRLGAVEMSLEESLGSEDWLKANEDKVKELFPDTWTNIQNLNALKLGADLKALGVNWRSEKEFEMIMVFFEKLGFILRDGQNVKRNPNTILI